MRNFPHTKGNQFRNFTITTRVVQILARANISRTYQTGARRPSQPRTELPSPDINHHLTVVGRTEACVAIVQIKPEQTTESTYFPIITPQQSPNN